MTNEAGETRPITCRSRNAVPARSTTTPKMIPTTIHTEHVGAGNVDAIVVIVSPVGSLLLPSRGAGASCRAQAVAGTCHGGLRATRTQCRAGRGRVRAHRAAFAVLVAEDVLAVLQDFGVGFEWLQASPVEPNDDDRDVVVATRVGSRVR